MIEMNRPSPTNAYYVLQALKEEEQRRKDASPIIDLYPYLQENDYGFIEDYYEREKELQENLDYGLNFLNVLDEELAYHCLYSGILEPVLQEMYCTSHQKELGKKTVRNYIREHGGYNVVNNMRNKGRYLLELATISDLYRNKILNETKQKCCKGLSEKDACEIEDGNINGLVFDMKDTIPTDIIKSISNKVEDSIVDFIDDNKKSKYQIKKIYDDAKAKLIKSTEEYPEDAEMLQQETMALAKSQEREILESAPCNLFKAMSSILMESVYKIDVLRESYSKSNGRVDFKKVLDDTVVLYTFLECLNTFNIENITESYINNMLKDMKNSINETSSTINSPAIDTIDKSKLVPKKDENQDEDNIEDKNVQVFTSKKGIMI